MVKRRPTRKKAPGVGILCRLCGEPLYVIETKPRKGGWVERVRSCRACGFRLTSSERPSGQ